ncbi:MAG: ATP-dependent zinc metalloprotease FtsH [Phycisphaerae bacterium]|nr:ATP-dependent zinc metalloprotease FtsH [Phycisphaerae bacterium]
MSSDGPSRNNNTPPKTPPGKPGPEGERRGMPPGRGLFGIATIIIIALVLMMLVNSGGRGDTITLADFETLVKNREIVPGSVEVRDDAVIARKRLDAPQPGERVVMIPLNAASSKTVVDRVYEITRGDVKSRSSSPWMLLVLVFGPFFLLFALWMIISRGLRGAGGGGGVLGNFGKSRHRTLTKEMTGVTFNDVAGVEEAKEEVTEIIEFLKNPKKFTKLGGRIPRGVLLVGEPGCGKTLLAKAIAGEADVPFFSISGSDFVEMFVGVGASRVRDLFKQAKDSAPCIIFLDEIDAVGRRRGGGFTSGGHEEREQTLNAILVEMDGFNSTDGVIVVAATNRADVLDPALTRPGRFDRQIVVPLPDVKGRLEILRVHCKKVKLGPDVNLEKIARGTPMFSGADLAAIINEAAINATMHNKDFIEHEDLEEARDKVKFGRAQRSRKPDAIENRATAYHEAGHAVLQAILPDADPLHKVTIIPRGQAMGATFSLPEKDRWGYARKWLLATMRVLCGGRIAEEKATGDVASGAAMDIAQVTNLARKMILEWGMSDKLGFVRYEGADNREMFLPDKEFSEDTAKLVDNEVRRLIDEAYADAKRVLETNWDKVVSVAEALLKYETLTSDDVARLIKDGKLDRATVEDLLQAETKRRAALPPPSAPDPEPPAGAIPSPA